MPRADWTITVHAGAPAETIVPGISGVGASALRVGDGAWRAQRNLISAVDIGIKGFVHNSTIGSPYHSSFFIARFVDAGNLYSAHFHMNGTSAILRVKAGYATTLVASSAVDFPAGVTHTPRLMVYGTNPATIQLDKGEGTPVILRAIDPSPVTSPGSAGFGIHVGLMAFAIFDDLTIFEVFALTIFEGPA